MEVLDEFLASSTAQFFIIILQNDCYLFRI